MSKLSALMFGGGIIMAVGGVLLMLFPQVMKYPYGAIGVAAGALLIISVLRGLSRENGK